MSSLEMQAARPGFQLFPGAMPLTQRLTMTEEP